MCTLVNHKINLHAYKCVCVCVRDVVVIVIVNGHSNLSSNLRLVYLHFT